MLHAKNIKAVLNQSIQPVDLVPESSVHRVLASILISAKNGSLICHASELPMVELKMLALLVQETWLDSISSTENPGSSVGDRFQYDLEDKRACAVELIKGSELLCVLIYDSGYPAVLRGLKMDALLEAFSGLEGYQLSEQ